MSAIKALGTACMHVLVNAVPTQTVLRYLRNVSEEPVCGWALVRPLSVWCLCARMKIVFCEGSFNGRFKHFIYILKMGCELVQSV